MLCWKIYTLLAKQVSVKDCGKVSLISVKLNCQVSWVDVLLMMMMMIETGLCAQIQLDRDI